MITKKIRIEIEVQIDASAAIVTTTEEVSQIQAPVKTTAPATSVPANLTYS